MFERKERAKRFAEIVKILARYGLAGWIKDLSLKTGGKIALSPERQTIVDMPFAKRLRLALTEFRYDLYQIRSGAKHSARYGGCRSG